MALFTVSRYMGEDESDLNTKEKSQSSTKALLEKIKSEAEARRLKRKKERGEDVQENDQYIKKKKRRVEENQKSNQSLHDNEENASTDFDQIRTSANVSFDSPAAGLQKVSDKKTKNKFSTDYIEANDSPTKSKKKGKRKQEQYASDKNKTLDTSYILSEQKGLDMSIDNSDEEAIEKDSGSNKAKQTRKKGKQSDDIVQNEKLEEDLEMSESSENESDVDTSQADATQEDMEGPHEVGGFTVLGKIKPKTPTKVRRVLPDWLADPNIIASDLKHNTTPVTGITSLDRDLVQKLHNNGITHFFPVQMQVIPAMLDSLRYGFTTGKAGFRPSDLCVSAPTGSGKTLAFVLPIIQALKSRVECKIRALAVLPVRDLATQVFKVFQVYCKDTDLKVELLVGQRPFNLEQKSLVKRRLRGHQSLADIVVATPGRLVDHINKTDGFDLSGLRFLVIDEADKMIDQIKQDWLMQVENAVFNQGTRHSPGPLTIHSSNKFEMPLQKLLFSATLTQNPEKLQQLNLFQPKLFTSAENKESGPKAPRPEDLNSGDASVKQEKDKDTVNKSEAKEQTSEFIGKFTTPTGLTEFFVECTVAEKPLMMLHFLHNLKFNHVLCFTNSVETAHRLYHLLKIVGGVTVQELSSRLRGTKHKQILQKFSKGKIDVLICSDALARGIDVEDVKYVISYDPPAYIKTYIHRVGRTARAGKVGTAVTLLQKKEFFHFKKMTREVGKAGIKELKVHKKSLEPIVPCFEAALQDLPSVLKGEDAKKK